MSLESARSPGGNTAPAISRCCRYLSCVAGYAAVIVLALYIGSPTVVGLYSRPAMLWLVCALFLFWISRIFVVTYRGNMHGDPLVFSLTDRPSLITGAVSGLVIFLSI